MFQANANMENRPGLTLGMGQARNFSLPSPTPASVQLPETLNVARSGIPRYTSCCSESTLTIGGCVTTVRSRSARPVFLSRSFEVASTINFALPACNWGVDLTPAVKLQVPSGDFDGCAVSKT